MSCAEGDLCNTCDGGFESCDALFDDECACPACVGDPIPMCKACGALEALPNQPLCIICLNDPFFFTRDPEVDMEIDHFYFFDGFGEWDLNEPLYEPEPDVEWPKD